MFPMRRAVSDHFLGSGFCFLISSSPFGRASRAAFPCVETNFDAWTGPAVARRLLQSLGLSGSVSLHHHRRLVQPVAGHSMIAVLKLEEGS